MSNDWQPVVLAGPAPAEARFLVHARQQFLVGSTGLLHDAAGLVGQGLECAQAIGIGYLGQRPIYLFELPAPGALAQGEWLGLRSLLVSGGEVSELQMLRYATQVGTWSAQHRFCGACGQRMVAHSGERAMCCPRCELRQYPRLSPCMITLVTDGDRVLLARSPHHPAGMYSTLAGFVEPGESVEQCVAREVLEEIGVAISAPQYVASQNWPFPHALMLGFRASYAGGEIVPQPGEIEDARWFPIDRLPLLPSPASIARYLIDSYCAERQGLPCPPLPV